MTDTINTGGAAFPNAVPERYEWAGDGMTLRDYFAAKAMQGMHATLIDSTNWPDAIALTVMAETAYAQADAMIAARGGAQ